MEMIVDCQVTIIIGCLPNYIIEKNFGISVAEICINFFYYRFLIMRLFQYFGNFYRIVLRKTVASRNLGKFKRKFLHL